MMIVEIKGLTKEYKRGKDGFEAVNEIDMIVDKGEFISIFGHSGCGKTTLFNIIAGLIKPSSGSVIVQGEDVVRKSEQELALYRNKTIGYLLQGQSLLPNFNLLENVCMPASFSKDKKDVSERAKILLKQVGLHGMEREKPCNMSGGELKRAGIVRAIINQPDIIIADEPTSSLDPENAEMIMGFLKELNEREGMTIIISSHDLDFSRYSNRTYRMNQGKFV